MYNIIARYTLQIKNIITISTIVARCPVRRSRIGKYANIHRSNGNSNDNSNSITITVTVNVTVTVTAMRSNSKDNPKQFADQNREICQSWRDERTPAHEFNMFNLYSSVSLVLQIYAHQ